MKAWSKIALAELLRPADKPVAVRQDQAYLSALVRMFGQALKGIAALPPEQRCAMRARLDAVRSACDGMGYGVGEDMDELLSEYGGDD